MILGTYHRVKPRFVALGLTRPTWQSSGNPSCHGSELRQDLSSLSCECAGIFLTKLPRSSFFLDASVIAKYLVSWICSLSKSMCREKSNFYWSFSSRAKNSREIYIGCWSTGHRSRRGWRDPGAACSTQPPQRFRSFSQLQIWVAGSNSPPQLSFARSMFWNLFLFFVPVGEREKKGVGWGWFVGYFSGDYCLCPIPDLTIGIQQALEHGFSCKKICLGGYVFFFSPAGVIHSCFRNWIWFLDTFWKTCGGVLFKSWTVFRSKLSGWEIMWSEIQLGTVAGFSFVQELLF